MADADSLRAKVEALERLARDAGTTPGERDAAALQAARLRAQLPPVAPVRTPTPDVDWARFDWTPYSVVLERQKAERRQATQARAQRRTARALAKVKKTL